MKTIFDLIENRSGVTAQQEILTNPTFFHFRRILSYWPLLHFVIGEKRRFPRIGSDQRITLHPITHAPLNSGYELNLEMPEDEYHPGVFQPFALYAIWLPLSQGELFAINDDALTACPLIRKTDNGKEILFLIHPKSVPYYQALLDQHKEQVFKVDALSLSSFRSLLVALPIDSHHDQPVLVKVSLDVQIAGVRRLVDRRECALSVVNSELFQQRLKSSALPLRIMVDPMAFVPAGYRAGMLYRELPDALNPVLGLNAETVLPLLALLTVKNNDLFQFLVRQNGTTITEFLESKIIKPFAKIFIELLYLFHLSLQGHGQNLMIVVDDQGRVKGLMYRDMGGVNLLPKQDDLASLPTNLQDPNLFYRHNHVKDAGIALEDHTVRRFLFYLTKQLVRCPELIAADPQLQSWMDFIVASDLIRNWMSEGEKSDAHARSLAENKFCRYGYAEQIFAKACLTALIDNQLISEQKYWQFADLMLHPEHIDGEYVAPPCTLRLFFEKMINETYSGERDPLQNDLAPKQRTLN